MTPPTLSETLQRIAKINQQIWGDSQISELATAAIPLAEKAEQDTARLEYYFMHKGGDRQPLLDLELRVLNGDEPSLEDWRAAIDKGMSDAARAKEGQKDVG